MQSKLKKKSDKSGQLGSHGLNAQARSVALSQIPSQAALPFEQLARDYQKNVHSKSCHLFASFTASMDNTNENGGFIQRVDGVG